MHESHFRKWVDWLLEGCRFHRFILLFIFQYWKCTSHTFRSYSLCELINIWLISITKAITLHTHQPFHWIAFMNTVHEFRLVIGHAHMVATHASDSIQNKPIHWTESGGSPSGAMSQSVSLWDEQQVNDELPSSKLRCQMLTPNEFRCVLACTQQHARNFIKKHPLNGKATLRQ